MSGPRVGPPDDRHGPGVFDVRVEVGPRPGILDPAGGVIERSLPALGYDNVSSVVVGKSIRLVVRAADAGAAREQVAEMCGRLLANPVIEDFSIEVTAR